MVWPMKLVTWIRSFNERKLERHPSIAADARLTRKCRREGNGYDIYLTSFVDSQKHNRLLGSFDQHQSKEKNAHCAILFLEQNMLLSSPTAASQASPESFSPVLSSPAVSNAPRSTRRPRRIREPGTGTTTAAAAAATATGQRLMVAPPRRPRLADQAISALLAPPKHPFSAGSSLEMSRSSSPSKAHFLPSPPLPATTTESSNSSSTHGISHQSNTSLAPAPRSSPQQQLPLPPKRSRRRSTLPFLGPHSPPFSPTKPPPQQQQQQQRQGQATIWSPSPRPPALKAVQIMSSDRPTASPSATQLPRPPQQKVQPPSMAAALAGAGEGGGGGYAKGEYFIQGLPLPAVEAAVRESSVVEFKDKRTGGPGKQLQYLRGTLPKAVCAFLNGAEGGTFYFGVDDGGVVRGVPADCDRWLQLIMADLDACLVPAPPLTDTRHVAFIPVQPTTPHPQPPANSSPPPLFSPASPAAPPHSGDRTGGGGGGGRSRGAMRRQRQAVAAMGAPLFVVRVRVPRRAVGGKLYFLTMNGQSRAMKRLGPACVDMKPDEIYSRMTSALLVEQQQQQRGLLGLKGAGGGGEGSQPISPVWWARSAATSTSSSGGSDISNASLAIGEAKRRRQQQQRRLPQRLPQPPQPQAPPPQPPSLQLQPCRRLSPAPPSTAVPPPAGRHRQQQQEHKQANDASEQATAVC